MSHFEITNRPASASASSSRRQNYVKLIIIHNDLASQHEALAEFTTPGASAAPHFYIAADGTITRLVSERRAAHHSGNALWEKRARSIDLISVGVMLEQALVGGSGAQLAALHWLIDQLEMFFGMPQMPTMRWRGPHGQQTRGTLYPYVPPPAPPVLRLPLPRTLGDDEPAPASRTLGDESDPQYALRLWKFLQEQTHAQMGSTLNLGWAFHLHACKFDLGAPMAPAAKTPLAVGGGSYGYQVFARDTLCNEGRNYTAVQSMASQIASPARVEGLALALVKASYSNSLATAALRAPARGTLDFRNDWKFHQVALQQRLGPPLSGNYATSDGTYAVQVFAGDTLFTPRSTSAGCQQLSSTALVDPAYAAIWAETYAAIGGTYDPNAPLQQFAAANKLGAPLGMPQAKPFEGTSYTVQVFGLDTLYSAPGGPAKRMSALPKPDEVTRWQASAPAAPPSAPPAGATLVQSGQPGRTPERVQRLINLATSLLGSDAAGLAKYPQLQSSVTGGDIVCADLVTFCLSEIGVKLWGNVSDPTKSGRTGRRAANYYRPDAANQGMLREVTNEGTWLPGDIMIYGIGDLSADRAYHVNIYVGSFSYKGRTNDVVNASQDMPDISAMTKEYCVQSHCWAGHYKWTRRVRVLELEREFAG